MSNVVRLLVMVLSLALAAVALPASAQEIEAPPRPSAPLMSVAPLGPSTYPWSLILETQRGPIILHAACCKTCRKGKACGDSCISRSYICRKGVGCACDG